MPGSAFDAFCGLNKFVIVGDRPKQAGLGFGGSHELVGLRPVVK